MKLTRVLFLLAALVASFAFSVQGQDEKVKTDKDKKTETKTGKREAREADKTGRKYLVGSKGGCYYLTESGKKSYVDKKFCEGVPNATTDSITTIKPTYAVTRKTGEQSDLQTTEVKTTETTPDAKTVIKTTETNPTKPKPTEPKSADVVTTENKKIDPAPASTNKKSNPDGRTYIKGPRGGCYYMNGDKKVYVKDKSLCEQ